MLLWRDLINVERCSFCNLIILFKKYRIKFVMGCVLFFVLNFGNE